MGTKWAELKAMCDEMEKSSPSEKETKVIMNHEHDSKRIMNHEVMKDNNIKEIHFEDTESLKNILDSWRIYNPETWIAKHGFERVAEAARRTINAGSRVRVPGMFFNTVLKNLA